MASLKLTCFAVVASLSVSLIGASPANALERLSGTWLTEDKSAQVLFQACGSSDCGQIVWLRDPIDKETGKPLLDKFNPDANLKGRPLIGVTVATALKLSNGSKSEVGLYNPLDGNAYSGKLQRLAADRVQIEVCVLSGLVCSTEVWTQVAP
jgi:uncharacterized protein (DUF2147 family)